MKIEGGTLGASGKADIANGNELEIKSQKRRRYKKNEIESVIARQEKNREFGCFGFVIGAIILAVVGLFIFGLLGAMIGLVLAVAGSFYTERKYLVDIKFTDGELVTISGSQGDIELLINLGHRPTQQ